MISSWPQNHESFDRGVSEHVNVKTGNWMMKDYKIQYTLPYLTIRPVALSGYGSAEWATDPWPLREKGLIIVLVSPN